MWECGVTIIRVPERFLIILTHIHHSSEFVFFGSVMKVVVLGYLQWESLKSVQGRACECLLCWLTQKKKTHECGIVSRLRMLGALHPTINGRMTKSPMKEIVQIFEQCKNSLADFVYWLPRDVNITIWHTKHTVNTHAILAIVVSSAQWKRSSSVLMQIVHSWFVFDTILYRS